MDNMTGADLKLIENIEKDIERLRNNENEIFEKLNNLSTDIKLLKQISDFKSKNIIIAIAVSGMIISLISLIKGFF